MSDILFEMNDKGDVLFLHADMREALKALPENSVDSVVTDPPYLLTSIVKRFGAENSAPAQYGKDGRFARLSGGFMSKGWDAPDVPAIDPEFANWMAGFIDGEGCFSVHKKQVNGCETYDCQFSLTLREDDKDIVVEMQTRLGGIGSIALRPGRDDRNAQIRYCISSQKDCWRLREILSVFPLRAKKVRDFQIWSQALDAWISHEPGESWEDIAYYRAKLMAVKRYGSAFHPSQLFHYQWAREVLRVLKPGGHLVAFGGTRGFARMSVAIEDAGFEIRDTLMYLYGSGFPKSHDVSKGIDKAAGAEREVVGPRPNVHSRGQHKSHDGWKRPWQDDLIAVERSMSLTAPATDAAKEWQGWGTSLKPALEPVILARKPLSEKTVVANVLRWRTGAINIDGCRVGTGEERKTLSGGMGRKANPIYGHFAQGNVESLTTTQGRWPANLVHDGSDEVVAMFPSSSVTGKRSDKSKENNVEGTNWLLSNHKSKEYPGDSGSAARFFYASKASKADRAGSRHPTIKPISLMRWLTRLITPPGGLVLDPFAGSGTTGAAALEEGMRCLLIEREAEYADDIRRRLAITDIGLI